MNGKCWKPAVNFDALWYWTHCDNILLAWAVKHLPTGCWTSARYNLTHHNCHTSSPSHSMQKAKYVRDYVAAKRKIGQLYIFIRREWITLCVKINGMPPPRVQVFVHDRMEGKFNQSIKWSWTWHWQESSQVSRLWAHTGLMTFTPTNDQQTAITSSATDMHSKTFSSTPVCLPWPRTMQATLPSKLSLLGGSGYLRMLSLMHRCLKGPSGIGQQFSLLIKN